MSIRSLDRHVVALLTALLLAAAGIAAVPAQLPSGGHVVAQTHA